MKILFFTEISPFPINGGERIRSYGLLKALSNLGHEVSAILQNIDDVDLDNYKIANVNFIVYAETKRSQMDRILQTNFFQFDRNVINLFDNQLKKNRPDLVILDYYKAGKYIPYFNKNSIPVIVGTHNVESKLKLQRPSKTILNYLGQIRDYLYHKVHESFIYRKARCVIAVSDLDKIYYEKILPKVKIHMIPNFLDESRYSNTYNTKEDYVVMTANFGAYMNSEGLKWLINEVWDSELDQKVKLYLVGKKSKEFGRKYIRGYSNINLIGEVDEISSYISKAKAVIIPLLHGSGTRLKCLEAMALKTNIISTSKGREGIESDNIVTVDSPCDFKSAILNIVPDQNDLLYQDFVRNYSLTANLQKVKRLLDDALVKDS